MAKKKLKATHVKCTTYKKYEKAQSVLANAQYLQAKDEFLSKFALCEIACKSVIEYYKKAQDESIDIKEIKLDMRSIPAAFAKFNYDIDRHILTDIFSASKNRGQKSAKKLRDCIVHALSEEDILEVINRKAYLYSVMDSFLNIIKEGQEQDIQTQEAADAERVLMLV